MSVGLVEIKEEKLDYGQDSNYGILLEPLLFLPESDKKKEAEVGVSKGLEDIEEILGLGIISQEKNNALSYHIEKFKSVVEKLGVGYNEGSKARRPLLYSIPPGIVIKVKNRRKAYGLLSDLGFGSALLVKI
ncbi:hypothetical protein CM19_13005 [Candidatus Acidianus copahuensis]|uniref:Uncharacterized protein n=1 Tax=Candidatus Acidianus copahuensis TaxID=1160895 RepID=A0A031LJ01_9CREN|nr:hypothetical protein [Candidatus Acidianus copahuensis]EZQ01531.1 hypothetical protein CM19_13005 [Candidatus Acidianus copahuensis]